MYLAHISNISNESHTEYLRRLPEHAGYGVADLVSNYVRDFGLAEDLDGEPAIKRISIRFNDRDSATLTAFANEDGERVAYRIKITTRLDTPRLRYYVETHRNALKNLDIHQHVVVAEEYFRKLY